MKKSFSSNPAGFSLIELLVGAAIMVTLLMALVSVMTNQANENRAVSEKLASVEIEREISATLSDSVSCGTLLAAANLSDPTDLTFDPSGLPGTPHNVSIISVPVGGGQPIVPGATPTNLSNTLKILPNPGVGGNPPGVSFAVTSASPMAGVLNVNFDQTALVRGIHNLQFGVMLSTIPGPPGQVQITGCTGKTPSNQSVCESIGGKWDSSASPPCSLSSQVLCTSMGGVWDGTKCSFPLPLCSSETANGYACSAYGP